MVIAKFAEIYKTFKIRYGLVPKTKATYIYKLFEQKSEVLLLNKW
jgi:hypothetical protein